MLAWRWTDWALFQPVNNLVDYRVRQLIWVAWSFWLGLGHALNMASAPAPCKQISK